MRKRKQNFWHKAVLYAAAFLLPAGILLEILRQGGFYPFGDKTLFIMDMRDQYLEFFAYLRYLFSGDNSPYFCWARSMGGNFLGLFAYYLASPLSFLTCLFPLERMPDAIVLLTVLKIGLCGVSFAVYADYLWRRQGSSPAAPAPGLLLFSAGYALISYNIVYSSCLMWLDSVILLPAVLLGVEKLLDGRKGLHCLLALAALFYCNYYTGYMAGLFTGIYFLYRLFCQGKARGRRQCLLLLGRFSACTVLAAGLSAPLLLPALYDLRLGKLTNGSTFSFRMERNFPLADFLGKLQNGAYDSITDTGLPAVYCGMAVLVFAAAFFLSPGISRREKLGATAVLGLLFVSFSWQGPNLIWHGFRAPVWFPYRYAFLFSFFLLYMAVRALWALKTGDVEKPASTHIEADTEAVVEAGVSKSKNERLLQYTFLGALAILTVQDLRSNGQALLSGLEREFGYCSAADYRDAIEKTGPLAEQIRQQDSGLYRVNVSYEYSKNDAMLFGYNGMTHYSSTYNRAVNSLTGKVGIAQSHIWNSGYGATPLLDSLFAVSYKLSDRPPEPVCYEKTAEGVRGTAAYRNLLALPMVYAAPAATLEPDLEGTNPYDSQNALLNAIAGGEKAYFKEIGYGRAQTGSGWIYTLTAETADPIYLYMNTDSGGLADLFVNDVWYGNYFSTESTCSVYIGSYAPGQEITVRVERLWGDVNAYNEVFALLDMDLLSQTLGKLRAGGMEITSHRGGTIQGRISLREGEKVITSIPCDEGWSVWVDGHKTDTESFAGTFLALNIPAGEHELRFAYVSPGFRAGLSLAAIAAAAVLLYAICARRLVGDQDRPGKLFRTRRRADHLCG